MNNPISSTLTGDTIFEETNDSTQSERDPKNDGVVLGQPAVEKPVTPLIPSTKAQVTEIPPTQNVQDPFKDDGNPPALDAQDLLA